MAIVQDNLLDRVDLLSIDIAPRLDAKRRSEMGQFFTPAVVARFLAGLLASGQDELSVLDPGAGVGTLCAALTERICQMRQPPRRVYLTAYEADCELVPHLQETVNQCGAACQAKGIEFECRVVRGDFIAEAVELLAGRALFEPPRLDFNCAILNPPYRKLNSQSRARAQLRSVGIETSNLYSAFLWLVFRLLVQNGELIAITPRSFCNGPYFQPFREALLREMVFTHLHVYESRKAAFKDADVLQENVVFRAVKSREPHRVRVSSSTGPIDTDVYAREISADELVGPTNSIHIVADEVGSQLARQINTFTNSLDDLGVQVSTGRVVEFRCRHALQREANGNSVPLIHPCHLDDGYVCWPGVGKKPNYLKVAPDTDALLIPAGVYVLVRRFSAKEETRRVTAAICDPGRLPGAEYGIENHLNYFHRKGRGLPLLLAKGLAAYLNSTLIDVYFRQFSGHTQVNAHDLRSLKYPDVLALERIGSRIYEVFPSGDSLDELIGEELNVAGDDRFPRPRRYGQISGRHCLGDGSLGG